jgi:hypothetical protein
MSEAQGVSAEFIAHLDERDLGLTPFRFLRDLIHVKSGVVADEVEPVAQDDEGIEMGAGCGAGELEFADAVPGTEELFFEFVEVFGEIILQTLRAGSHIADDFLATTRKGDDDQFIENGGAVSTGHLDGTITDGLGGFFKIHRAQQIVARRKAASPVSGKGHFVQGRISSIPTLEIGDQVGHALRIDRLLEALGHEGKAGGLQGDHVSPANGFANTITANQCQ